MRRILESAQHPFLQHSDFRKERAALSAAYQERAFGPFWLDGAGKLTPQALALLQAMRTADELGLDPGAYEASGILLEAADSVTTQAASRRAQVDVAVSIAAIRFVTHLHYGRIDPNAVGFEMPVRSIFDLRGALENLASSADTSASLALIEPQFRHYRLLKQALAAYRQLAVQPQLTQLPPLKTRAVKPGQAYEGAAALRMLLAALGDMQQADAGNTDPALDGQLVEAIKRFQFRHGLRQDGALGRETLAELTTALSVRVRQIQLTLERWRWLPTLDAPTIIVNIPQFRLFAFPTSEDREAQMLTMDVIVGKTFPKTRTPVFAADLKYVKFRPYWDVPYSIMAAEMLPHLRSDPNYLQAYDLEVVGSQGDDATALPATTQNIAALAAGKLRVRQRPGPDNALGLVKFMLPNKHNVYLHSTPARGLFNEARRAFSHGCIRVSDPVALAQYVLRNASEEWSRERIEAALTGRDNQRVDLKQWVRVLIVYGTAVATEGGSVYFFDDIYGNDARLAQLLSRLQ